MEKYSVLMSLYREEKPEFLDAAIKSMVEQTYEPDEIVIVKDGLITAELEMILDKYIKIRPDLFHVIGYEINRGLGWALNYGLKNCRNELVARMDTDDISKPQRCELQVKRFEEKPYLSIVGAWIDEFETDLNHVVSTRVVPEMSMDIYKFAKRRSAFNHPVVMYRKSKVLEHNGYSDMRRNQDVDLFGRMLFAGCQAENIGESLLYFRANSDLVARRKSWENTRSYINTIRRFYKMGYASILDYAIVAIAQTCVYVLPLCLQKSIYRYLLRR